MESHRVRWNRLAILVAGGLGLLLLACVVIWALAPNLRRILQAPFWKTDPQLTAQAAHQMVDYDLPPSYNELKVLTVQDRDAAVIISHRERPGDLIYIGTLMEGILGVEEWRVRYEENLSQEVGGRRYNTQVVGTQETTVRGQPVTLRLLKGTDENGRAVRQVVCGFTGKSGDLLLAIVASQETWDQTMVDSFLKSIR
jgi:hypothetical protein